MSRQIAKNGALKNTKDEYFVRFPEQDSIENRSIFNTGFRTGWNKGRKELRNDVSPSSSLVPSPSPYWVETAGLFLAAHDDVGAGHCDGCLFASSMIHWRTQTSPRTPYETAPESDSGAAQVCDECGADPSDFRTQTHDCDSHIYIQCDFIEKKNNLWVQCDEVAVAVADQDWYYKAPDDWRVTVDLHGDVVAQRCPAHIIEVLASEPRQPTCPRCQQPPEKPGREPGYAPGATLVCAYKWLDGIPYHPTPM